MYNRKTDTLEILAFANYSTGLFANVDSKEPDVRSIDYSKVEFSTNPPSLHLLGKRLAKVCIDIETSYGGVPQDIEGALTSQDSTLQGDHHIYIVQTRSQV